MKKNGRNLSLHISPRVLEHHGFEWNHKFLQDALTISVSLETYYNLRIIGLITFWELSNPQLRTQGN